MNFTSALKMILSIVLLGVCFLQTMGLFAQEKDSIIVYHYISDSFTKQGVPDVFVTLTDTNGIVIDTMRTHFAWGTVALWQKKVARRPQTFLVKAEHPDYETAVMRLTMDSPARRFGFVFPPMYIKRQMNETTMREVTVRSTRIQLAYKGDTIVVDAEAFKIPEGSMLNALVAQVPGAELREDGTIYMNGRLVDYLTLNGKDFFKGKNRIMLDNLPYYVVSKLKFFEKNVPLSQMIHRDTGEKDYVMDVELKQEYSIGYMANAEAGIGTNGRWMGRLFGLRFTNNSRLVLFGNVNNTNETRAPGGEGWESKPNILTGEKETKIVGGSLNVDDKNKRFVEHLDVSANWTDNVDETRISRETFLSDGSVFGRSHHTGRNKDFSTSIMNNLEIPKIATSFKTTADYAKQDGKGLSRSASFDSDPAAFGNCLQILDSLFAPTMTMGLQQIGINRVLDKTMYGATSYNIGQNIDRDKGLPNGDEMYIKLNGNYGSDQRDGFSRYDLTYFDQTQARNKQDRYTPNHHTHYSYGGEVMYRMNLFNGWMITYGYNYLQKYDDNNNLLYRLDALGESLDFGILPSQAEYLQTIDAGNSYRSQYMTKNHCAHFAVRRIYDKESYKILYGIVTNLNHKDESLHYRRSNNWYDKREGNWLVEPMAYYECRPHGNRKLGFKVQYDSQPMTPNLVQMLNVEDTSNPLAITLGNPDLKVARRHHMTLQTTRGKFGAACQIQLDVNILDNLVANGFTYNPVNGVYTYRPENVKGNRNGTAYIIGNLFLDTKKRLLMRGRSGYNYFRNIDLTRVDGFTTSQQSRVDRHIASQNITLSYNKESLRLEAMGDFAWNVAKRELMNSSDISAFDFSYGLSGQYTFPWKIQFATDLKIYSRRGYEESSMNRDEPVWNVSVSRPFMTGKLVVKLDAFDVLNQLSGTRYFVNGQGRTETWQLTMPRYAMLRVAYKFNKNPKKE